MSDVPKLLLWLLFSTAEELEMLIVI